MPLIGLIWLSVSFLTSNVCAQPLSWPVDQPVITQQYAARDDAGLTSGRYKSGRNTHVGVDLVSSNPAIKAAGDGEVVQVFDYRDPKSFLGNAVILKHSSHGVYTVYGHLAAKPSLSPGQTIAKGQTIGVMGGSGPNNLTNYPIHLHFEVKPLDNNKSPSILDNSGIYAGYTPGHPDLYGYHDPRRYIRGSIGQVQAISLLVTSSTINPVDVKNAAGDVYDGGAVTYQLTTAATHTVWRIHSGQIYCATKSITVDGALWYFIDVPNRNRKIAPEVDNTIYGPTGGWVKATDVSVLGGAIAEVANAQADGEVVRDSGAGLPTPNSPEIARVFKGQRCWVDPTSMESDGVVYQRIPVAELVAAPSDPNPSRLATQGWIRRDRLQFLQVDSTSLQCISEATGQPIPNAPVSIDGQPKGTTDGFGWFRILSEQLGIPRLFEVFSPQATHAATVAIPANLAGSATTFELPATTTVAASTRFQTGDRVAVANTEGMGLRGRYPASTSSTYDVLPERVEGTVVDGPSTAGGYNRWRVSFPGYPQPMWCAEGEPDGSAFYLVPAAAATDPHEPNESSPAAKPLALAQSVQAYISSPSDVDWFRVDATSGAVMTVTLEVPAGVDYDVELYGPDATWAAGSYEPLGASESINFTVATPGTHWIRVYGYPLGNGAFNTSQPYALSCSLVGGTPAPKFTESSTAVTITGWYGEPVGALEVPAVVNGKPVTTIGASAFENLRQLTRVTIPSSVTSIGSHAFASCSALTEVVIPSTVTTIGFQAFSYCSSLTSITLPSGLKSIGSGAFFGCGLTSVAIPSTVTSIGMGPFSACWQLTSISVSSSNASFTAVDGVLFDKLMRLLIQYPCAKEGDTYAIPASVTSIGGEAFYVCHNLTSMTVPSGVTTIGIGPFAACENLEAISVASGNSAFVDIDGVLFDKAVRTLVQYPRGRSAGAHFQIPGTVTKIGGRAFESCSQLQSIDIPSGVTVIEQLAFNGCSGLSDITLPSGITRIEWRSFQSCRGLTSIVIPSGVTYIGDYAFAYCSGLRSVVIPAAVQTINFQAFAYCDELMNVEFVGNAPSMGDQVFHQPADCFAIYYHNFRSGFTSPTWNGYPAVNIDTTSVEILVSPTSEQFRWSGGSGAFTVSASTAWKWRIDADWVTSNEPLSQIGGQTFSYAVETNMAADSRTATIQIAGLGVRRSFAVTQSGWVVTPPLTIVTELLPNGFVGETFSLPLEAVGGWPAYNWSVSAGSLPPGLSLGNDGVIRGTPLAPTFANFMVTVMDADGASASRWFTLQIRRVPTAQILGAVRYNGVGLPGVFVTAFSWPGSDSLDATTDQFGNFVMPATGGSWYLSFWGSAVDQYRANSIIPQGVTISVGDGETSDGNIFDILPSTGTLSGTVTDEFGAAVRDASVSASAEIDGTYYQVSAMTDADGFYSLPVTDGLWNGFVWATGFSQPAFFDINIQGSGMRNVQLGSGANLLTYGTWVGFFFTDDEVASGESADDNDFDGDGLSNLLEYALGGDARFPDADYLLEGGPDAEGRLLLSFVCDSSRSDLAFFVQASSTLEPDSWTTIAQSTGGATFVPIGSLAEVEDFGVGSRWVTVTDTDGAGPTTPRRFLRLKVERQ